MYNCQFILEKLTKNNFKINGDKLRTICFKCVQNDLLMHIDRTNEPFNMEVSLEDGTFHCNNCNCEGGLSEYLKGRCGLSDEQIQEELNNFMSAKIYADDINLPLQFLYNLGIETLENSIAIPFYNRQNEIIAVKNLSRNGEFKWQSGTKTDLYGLWKLREFTDNSYIILTQGEENAQALWYHNIQALACPTGVKFKEDFDISVFDNFNKIYVVANSTLDSSAFISDVRKVLPCDKLYKIFPNKIENTCKTVLDLHKIDKLNSDTLIATATTITNAVNEKTVSEATHVTIGKKVIELLNLKYFNNNLYTYKDGIFNIATDKLLHNCILRQVDVNAKSSIRNESIRFMNDWLANSTKIKIDARYINCLNGFVDLETGELIVHTPNIFSLNQVHFNFIPDLAPNPLVDNYLNELMCGNKARILALLQLVGYCCSTSVEMQQSVIWYGKGSNGKSKLAQILIALVGEENTSHVELQTFEKQFGTSEIDQKLLNIVPELPAQKIKDVGTFKGIVTGDKMKANVKYKERVDITPYAKHIFSTNALPQVKDTTDGFYRRLNILLFENKFDPTTSNFKIDDFLKQENLDYLGSLGIKEYIKLLHSNTKSFANAQESLELVQEYKINNDTILSFLTDEDTQALYDTDTRSTAIWLNYKAYCVDNRLTPVNKQEFYRRLKEDYGFTKKIINGYTYFYKAKNDFSKK